MSDDTIPLLTVVVKFVIPVIVPGEPTQSRSVKKIWPIKPVRPWVVVKSTELSPISTSKKSVDEKVGMVNSTPPPTTAGLGVPQAEGKTFPVLSTEHWTESPISDAWAAMDQINAASSVKGR